MTKSRTIEVWAGRTGLTVGLAIAAFAATGWTMPHGKPPTGVAATLTVAPTGELAVDPSGQIAHGADLRPGSAIDGTFLVQNATGTPVRVFMRAAPATRDLDAQMEARFTFGRRVITDASLADARSWAGGVRLRAGERRRMRARLALPAGARGYEQRAADVRVELRAEVRP